MKKEYSSGGGRKGPKESFILLVQLTTKTFSFPLIRLNVAV